MSEKIREFENKVEEKLCHMCNINPAVGRFGICDSCQAKITEQETKRVEANLNKNPISRTQKATRTGRVIKKNVEEPSPSQENALKDLEELE